MWMIAALIGLAGAAPSPGPDPGPAETGASMAFHDQLAAAKAEINRGNDTEARALLEALARRLDAGERPPTPIAHEALVYLGDLRYVAGEQDGAREAFRTVLLDEPDHVISPYHHTEDVRAFFALVRDQVEAEIARRPPPVPVPVPKPPPVPIYAYAPLGIPQIADGRAPRGVLFGGLQLLFATTSIGTYAITKRANTDPTGPGGHPFNWQPDQVPRRVAALRYGVQWPSTVLFYATWAGSVLEANAEWRKAHRASATVGVTPGGIVVHGRF
ncbi:MAG: tetratricopeptide repeat protein [Alphaproteobacteria bacterium]|nr:tetratricopeptide repeat protein [Alphaproteobacteria bacterium]